MILILSQKKGLVEPYGGLVIKYVVQKKKQSPPSQPPSFTYDSKKNPMENFEMNALKYNLLFLQYLSDDKKDTEYRELFNFVHEQHSEHIPLLLLHAKFLNRTKTSVTEDDQIIDISNKIISLIDQNELALFFGINRDDSNEIKKNGRSKI